MTFTRELVLLAATALAWFAYAVTGSQPDLTNPLLREVTHTTALVLSGVIGVRFGGLILLDGLMERVWGVPTNALIRLVVYMVLAFVATALVLKYGLDLNLATLLTTSALLTAILGFAMQSTLAAFFSGVALQMEQHIRPGDGIFIDGTMARVETIGWRSITARRVDGTLIMVPNTTVAAGPVPIRRPGDLTRTVLVVPAPLAAPPAMIGDLLSEAMLHLPELAADQPIVVELVAIRTGEGLADFRVSFFTRPAAPDDQPMEALARVRIWYAYQRHGIMLGRAKASPDPEALGPLASASAIYPAELPANLLGAFSASRRWRSSGAAELERLAHGGRRLLYAPEEPILLPRDFDGATVLVVAGEVRLSHDDGASLTGIDPALHEAADAGPAARWDMEVLLRVEAELAAAIGPYARRATRQAAQEAADLATLYGRLASLIEEPEARARFLKSAPQGAVRDFGPGTAFVVHCAGRGPASASTRLFAVDHVELLAIPAELALDRPQTLVAAAS